MAEIKVKWTGQFPNLCSGNWELKIDGEDYSDGIPFKNKSANTYGRYEEWHFEEYEEIWNTYTAGLKEKEWIDEYRDWLKTLPITSTEYSKLYAAFSVEDW